MYWNDYIFVLSVYGGLVIAILEILWAIYFIWKYKNKLNIGLGFITLLLNGIASFMMIVMILGAWPTIIPLLIIMLTTFILLALLLYSRKTNKQNRSEI